MPATAATRQTRAAAEQAAYTVDITFRCATGVSARVTRKTDKRRSYLVQLSTCGILSCTCPDAARHTDTPCKHSWLVVAELEATR